MAIENLKAGDIFGYKFPTSDDPSKAHPALVLDVLSHAQRQSLLRIFDKTDIEGADLCLLLMISHSYPKKDEFGELIILPHRSGTALDAKKDIYACYRHFDLAFLPTEATRIASVDGEYLGRMGDEGRLHYQKQFMAVQAFLKGKSFKKPDGVFVA